MFCSLLKAENLPLVSVFKIFSLADVIPRYNQNKKANFPSFQRKNFFAREDPYKIFLSFLKNLVITLNGVL
jgi:hypothetical protein